MEFGRLEKTGVWREVWNESEMALLGLNLGQRTVVLTVFVVFGALSLFLIIFHVEAEAQFDSLKIGGAPYPGTFAIVDFYSNTRSRWNYGVTWLLQIFLYGDLDGLVYPSVVICCEYYRDFERWKANPMII